MRSLLKVTKLITLLSFLVSIAYLPVLAQNTAPVPSTFEILSPSDGNLPSILNLNYAQNKRVFYGGDFANYGDNGAAQSYWTNNTLGFKGYTNPAGVSASTVARGNFPGSRLTLGGTEWGLDVDSASVGSSYVASLPGGNSSLPATSFDKDDLGYGATIVGAGSYLNYTGGNGFIAINEEDSLVIRLTGYIDPNNRLKYTGQNVAANSQYGGALLQSVSYTYNIANPANDGANGVKFGVVPSTLPAGASFNGNLFVWVPNFIQGDGTSDNSLRNGIYFVDANISDGFTTSQLVGNITLDSTSAKFGRGNGELADSLYVVYFTASDDGIPPLTAADSLFIMVNDSIENPPPVFTSRQILTRTGSVLNQTRTSSSFNPDSALTFYEGDSIKVTFYGKDQGEDRGGTNDHIDFSLVNWSDFLHRSNRIDTLTLVDTTSVTQDGEPVGLSIHLKLGYNVTDSLNALKDTMKLVVSVDDNTTLVTDTLLFIVRNVNRPPIWDADTSTRPSDSALVFAFDPAVADPTKIDAFTPIPVANNATDTIYFSQYIYDPDVLIGDSLGPAITYSASGAPASIVETTGMMELSFDEPDTASYAFTVTGRDTYSPDRKSATKAVTIRVAPAPDIAEVYPAFGYPGQNISIFGTGFALFDTHGNTPSRVVFRARSASGTAQNLTAVINSWSRDRINITIPEETPVSRYVLNALNQMVPVPDTIEVYSAVFGSPTYYPYVISEPDTTTVSNMEVTNLSPTSAVIKWKTAFTGVDSLVLAYSTDTLDVFTQRVETATGSGLYWPVFVTGDPATSPPLSSVINYTGSTASTDQLHYITITDLNPGTDYRFFICMKNSLFFGDTVRNVNGPYFPKKIDLTQAVGTNSSISSFRLRTPPQQASIGETFIVQGKVFTSTAAATNAIVTVRIIDSQNVADTSMGLVATVKSDSTWELNLGNAVSDTFGVSDRVFSHKQGDYLLITVQGNSDVGFSQFTVTRGGSSPQTIVTYGNGILLAPSVSYDIRLKVGLNLIGIPVQLFTTEPQTAWGLLNRMQGGLPAITGYDPANGGTQLPTAKTISGTGTGFIGENFNLELYAGYFVKASQLQYLTLNGSVIGGDLPVYLMPGAALYWISRPAQEQSLFYAWSARTMLSNIANAQELFRFNEDNQQYEDALVDPVTQNFVGTDFHIDVSEGYILRISNNSQWDINTPSSVLLANASSMFDNKDELTPAITLNTTNKADAGAETVRNVRLTDVTSSAAAVSWITNGTGTGLVRFGKADRGLTNVAYFDKELLDGGMRYVRIQGLEPETEYVYEIVSNGLTYNNNGLPFVFKTAQVGIGGEPYSVFGRLVSESGNPLPKALVYVEIKGEALSAPLSAITDERGYWIVNLANLKTADGNVFAWQKGDEIKVSAAYGDNSTSFRALVSGLSPQNVVTLANPDDVAQDQQEVVPAALPKAFALAQNFPNPFNPSTTIAFDIPDNTDDVRVQLMVYNIRGQLIRTLVDEVVKPGHHLVQWDGLNEKGEVTSSGVYFYRIKAGDFIATRKMVVLK